MADDVVIRLRGVHKDYSLEQRPLARLWQQLSGRPGRAPVHHALAGIDLVVRRGETVGIVGRNGAGKSTLLQILAGVLQPSAGTREVRGRVAALLELGAGFNPELSGRENVRLNGPLMGLSAAEIERRLPAIVEFADIGEFVDQPVRSYSSGMFVRLAFAMATSVEPDILIVDEALSVGDGAFARKSFDRIMALRDRGATVLFCSHSLFQVESVCQRALWIHDGRLRFDGRAAETVVEYQAWLDRALAGLAEHAEAPKWHGSGSAAITGLALVPADRPLRSRLDDLELRVGFSSDPRTPAPTLGIIVHAADGRSVTSAGSWIDGPPLVRNAEGAGVATLRFPALPLLKGRYTVSAYLLCERGIHLYGGVEHGASFEVTQEHVEQGLVWLPRQWQAEAAR